LNVEQVVAFGKRLRDVCTSQLASVSQDSLCGLTGLWDSTAGWLVFDSPTAFTGYTAGGFEVAAGPKPANFVRGVALAQPQQEGSECFVWRVMGQCFSAEHPGPGYVDVTFTPDAISFRGLQYYCDTLVDWSVRTYVFVCVAAYTSWRIR
jgi:hypothetical protein